MKQAGKVARSSDWKRKWPTTGNLRAWLLCHIDKCNAFSDVEQRASKAQVPIALLAEHGHPKEALRVVNRFLKSLMAARSTRLVSMAETGAEICLDQNDVKGAEKYLEIALKADKFVTRKCDVGYVAGSVRHFRALHGLLDPDEAEDEDDRHDALFHGAERRCLDAIRCGDRKVARKELAAMYQAAKQGDDDLNRSFELKRVLKAAAQLGDRALVRQYMAALAKADRDEVLDYDLLSELGMRDEAITAALRSIKRETKELVEDEDPNIHFPVTVICGALKFLIAQGEKDLASKALMSVVKTSDKWTSPGRSWGTSAVLSMFAEVIAVLEGTDAAQALLDQAREDAGMGPRSDFQQGVRTEAIEIEAKIGLIESALEKARKLRSPASRRSTVATILARAGRWKEIPAVCSAAANPEEAAELALRIGGVIRLPD
jgi:hypothetical protein